jgi:hypothetical protein
MRLCRNAPVACWSVISWLEASKFPAASTCCGEGQRGVDIGDFEIGIILKNSLA